MIALKLGVTNMPTRKMREAHPESRVIHHIIINHIIGNKCKLYAVLHTIKQYCLTHLKCHIFVILVVL